MTAAAPTFTMLAPAANSYYEARGSAKMLSDNFGLLTAVPLSAVRDLVAEGCVVLPGATNDAAAWNANLAAPQALAAAGASQASAAAITQNTVNVTTTTSSEGCILKAVATGAVTEGYIVGTHAFKLYPPSNGKFDSVTSTNEAKLITANTGFRVRQRTATLYSIEFI